MPKQNSRPVSARDNIIPLTTRKTKKQSLAQWLASVPPGYPKDKPLKLTVEMEMHPSNWFLLAQGASANGWTLGEAIVELVVEGLSGGLCEWSNNDFATMQEVKEDRMKIASEVNRLKSAVPTRKP